MLLEGIEEYRNHKRYNSESVVDTLAELIDSCCDKEVAIKALRKIHESILGHHFNEKYADMVVSEFYYLDKDGNKVSAPFVTKDKAKDYYSKYSRHLSDVDFYDFYVALNKVMSDHKKLLTEWFDEDQVLDKCVELTLSCIMDDDYPGKECKIWDQLSYYKK